MTTSSSAAIRGIAETLPGLLARTPAGLCMFVLSRVSLSPSVKAIATSPAGVEVVDPATNPVVVQLPAGKRWFASFAFNDLAEFLLSSLIELHDGERVLANVLPELVDHPESLAEALCRLVTGIAWEDLPSIVHSIGAAMSSGVDGLNWIPASFDISRSTLRLRGCCTPRRSGSMEIHIDQLAMVDPTTFYVRGWFSPQRSSVHRLTAVSPEGAKVEILDQLARYRRTDLAFVFEPTGKPLDGPAFSCRFTLPYPSYQPRGWMFELADESGQRAVVEGPPVLQEHAAVRDMIVDDTEWVRPPNLEILENHIIPAVAILQSILVQNAVVRWDIPYGPTPSSPRVSVVIPLYGNLDYLEHQLSHFASDASFREDVELLYVTDGPELAPAIERVAPGLYELYRVPFHVLSTDRQAGYARATNLGVERACAPYTMLLNSDIFPETPGWLQHLVRIYESVSDIGALGPKLLYHDDSIQHAGMFFARRQPETEPWVNLHHFKGFPRAFPPANVPRPVAAVTGAALLVTTQAYWEAGGMPERYVQGDFEDSEFCLRLCALGRQNWYTPEVELYHLEGQSYPSNVRRRNWVHNSWLHTLLYDEAIDAAMRCMDPSIEKRKSRLSGRE